MIDFASNITGLNVESAVTIIASISAAVIGVYSIWLKKWRHHYKRAVYIIYPQID